MEAYSGFAEVYDFLMRDVDYNGWVDYLEKIFNKKESNPHTILEIACGTGNITNELAQRGYDIVGIDKSIEMLAFAKNKADDLGVDVKYLHQDMRKLDYNKSVDSVLCLCDGINYILQKKELIAILKKVYSLLKKGGLFVFDISSYYKLSKILGNNIYAENFENVSYIWENYFDYEESICELDLTIFKRKNKLFERYQEYHYQRAYKAEEIFDALKESGFKNISCYKSFTFENISYEDDRINFVCKR